MSSSSTRSTPQARCTGGQAACGSEPWAAGLPLASLLAPGEAGGWRERIPVLLLRHGDCGPARLPGPAWDPPLTPSARAALPGLARRCTAWLEGIIPMVLSSDLRRCLITARHLARALGAPLRIETALREQDFGAWCGLTWNDIDRHDSSLVLDDPLDGAAPGGEPFRACASRAALCVRATLAAGAPALCVVAHAGPLRGILADLLGLDLATSLTIDWPRGAASLIMIDAGGSARLRWHGRPPSAA